MSQPSPPQQPGGYISLLDRDVGSGRTKAPLAERLLAIVTSYARLGILCSNIGEESNPDHQLNIATSKARLNPWRIRSLFVKKHHWLRHKEFRELLHLAQSLPGVTILQLTTSVAAVLIPRN